jgi:hypothetical protein
MGQRVQQVTAPHHVLPCVNTCRVPRVYSAVALVHQVPRGLDPEVFATLPLSMRLKLAGMTDAQRAYATNPGPGVSGMRSKGASPAATARPLRSVDAAVGSPASGGSDRRTDHDLAAVTGGRGVNHQLPETVELVDNLATEELSGEFPPVHRSGDAYTR